MGTVGKGMTPEQAEKMKEIRSLLEQAKRAREEIQSFSGSSRTSLWEKLRTCKLALKKEKEEKREMKDRLLHAFEHVRQMREQQQRIVDRKHQEEDNFRRHIEEMKERHRRELRRLKGDDAVIKADRHERYSQYGEQVIEELTSLQHYVRDVRKETVDEVLIEGNGSGTVCPNHEDAAETQPLLPPESDDV